MTESKFQFKTPILEQVDFKINPNFTANGTDVKIENTFNINISKNSKQNFAIVHLELLINKNTEDAPFSASITISSKFTWNRMCDDEIDKMLNTNAPAVLLSYARPIIANLTNSSPYPAYNLPLINFNK